MNDEDRTISGAARVEIEEDHATKQTPQEYVRAELEPALRELRDEPGLQALALLALVEKPDGTRVWTWIYASADQAPYFIDSSLSAFGKIIRNAEARQVAEDVDDELRGAPSQEEK